MIDLHNAVVLSADEVVALERYLCQPVSKERYEHLQKLGLLDLAMGLQRVVRRDE